MPGTKEINYWKLQKDELLRELNASAMGLNDAEAARRLKAYGLNEIPSIEHRTSLRIFASQFKNPLVYVLVFASVLAGFLGDVTEATIIVAIVLANSALGFALEHRSERAVDELRKYLSYTTIVVRNGQKLVLTTSKLVPGDIVNLAIGDVVPADIRLLEADELQMDESVLTGESTSVDKNPAPVELDKPLPHQ